MRLFRDYFDSSVAVLAAHILARGSLSLASILVAREFSAEEFAAYSYYQVTISTFATFASFGLGTSAARHFALLTKKDFEEFGFPFGTLWAVGFIVPSIAGIFLGALPVRWVGDAGVPQVMMAAGVAALLATVVPSGAMLGLQLFRLSVLSALASAVAMMVLLYVSIKLESLHLAVWALVLGFLVQCIGDSLCVIRRVGGRRLWSTFHIDIRSLCRLAGFAGPMFMVSVLNAAALWVVARIVRASDPTQREFVLFSIGMQWFSLVLVLPSVLAKVSLPMLVRSEDTNRPNVALLGGGVAFLVALLGGIAVLACAGYLDVVYGGKYSINWVVLAPFMLAAAFNAPAGVLGNLVVVAGFQWRWLGYTVLATLSYVGLAWLTRSSGALGGGIGVMVGSMVLALLSGMNLRSQAERIR